MGPLIELFVATVLIFGGAGFGAFKAVKLLGSTGWAVRRRQRQNRHRIEHEAKFRCNEHKKLFTHEELVDRGGTLYCPECYKQHIFAESISSNVITDLGEIHKDLGLKR